MNNVDTRQVNRDSLFLLAQLRVDGRSDTFSVKVRNLSAGGMMAEGAATVVRGQLVEIELRNLGWVKGSVAWKQDNRFGIAFIEEIDPKKARASITSSANSQLSSSHTSRPAVKEVDVEKLRKI